MRKINGVTFDTYDWIVEGQVSTDIVRGGYGVEFLVTKALRAVISGKSPDSREFKDHLLGLVRERQSNRFLLLIAHGDTEEGRLVYYDGEKRASVQSWINREDRKNRYAGVLIDVCNPGKADLSARYSPLIYPYGEIGPDHRERTDTQEMQVVLPSPETLRQSMVDRIRKAFSPKK